MASMPTLLVVLCALLATATGHVDAHRGGYLQHIVSHAWRQLVDSHQHAFPTPLDTWSCVDIGTWLQSQKQWRPVELQQYAKALCTIGVTGATLHAVDGTHVLTPLCSASHQPQRKYCAMTSKSGSAFTASCSSPSWTSCAPNPRHSCPTLRNPPTLPSPLHPITWCVAQANTCRKKLQLAQVLLQYLSLMSVPRSTLAVLLTWRALSPSPPLHAGSPAKGDKAPPLQAGALPPRAALAGTRALLEHVHTLVFSSSWVRCCYTVVQCRHCIVRCSWEYPLK